MILTLFVALAARAEPCDGAITDYIAAVQARGEQAAYLCLVARDDAEAPLLEAIAQAVPAEKSGTKLSEGADPTEVQPAVAAAEADRATRSLTRALTVYLAARLDRKLSAEEVRALNPDDARLLRDAIFARRGRRSPSAEHDKVFSQFDWYTPDERYDNGRLTEVDRANLAMIDHPPPPPEPPTPAPAADAMSEAAQRQTQPGGCGCDAAGGGFFGWLPLLVVARRRRKGA